MNQPNKGKWKKKYTITSWFLLHKSFVLQLLDQNGFWWVEPFLIKLFFWRPFRYDFMTKCWNDDPHLRPSFEKLRNKLKEMENRHKVEWQSLQRDSLCSFFPFQSLIVGIYHRQINLITTAPWRLASVVYGFNLFSF